MIIETKHHIQILEPLNPIKTLVFINGFGTEQDIWSEVIKPFKENYKIILFENIGSSKSDLNYFSPNKYDSLNAYSKDLNIISKKLNLENSILVGHSVGGMIGLLSTIQNPNYYSKLVMIGSSPRYLNDSDYYGGFEKKELENLFESMRANYFAWASGFAQITMNTPENPKLSEYFAASLKSIQADVAISVAKTIFYSDHRNDLAKVKIPTLILKTREDIAVPPQVSDYMQSKITGSRKIEVNAKGHFPHLSSPIEVIHAIESFL
ncbi:MAG TPA: alpha/beta hydrolase [Leptospiraceae bacterium]|nr:alpha/beta hydrolase [Leptospiraceae bacterium]HMW06615.1 alpha/beta hydrolase [Leptospiraceae bacterium]HMX32043.1 alpha/beta hydrolase [Leptospiraceae bacterium]HMY31194.1 alpha/beta hydrolase [Leptospiraceae bacterium]HMZ63319.1 alpha/beta hydrolase [Leptospiraceae bacterium]